MTKKFYTEEFSLLQQSLHNNQDWADARGWEWGGSKEYTYWKPNVGMVPVNDLVDQLRPKTVLDYGCGKAYGISAIEKDYPDISFTKFDPFVDEFSKYPTGTFDLVTCYKVLNQVEFGFRKQVIEELYELTGQHLFLGIIVYQENMVETIKQWLAYFSKYNIQLKTIGPKYKLQKHRVNYVKPTVDQLNGTANVVDDIDSHILYLLIEKQ